MARRKAAEAQVSPRFVVGDVTRLTELGLGVDYGLFLDLGCFHSIPDAGRDAYFRGVSQVARAGATMLLFCFVRGEQAWRFGPPCVAAGEVSQRITTQWEMVT